MANNKHYFNTILLSCMSLFITYFVEKSSSDSDSLFRTFYSNLGNTNSFKLLQLEKGAICREDGDYECTSPKDCNFLEESIKSNNYLDICKYNKKEPIICCPMYAPDWYTEHPPKSNGKPSKQSTENNKQSSIAVQKCRQYNNLDYPKVDNTQPAVIGGVETVPQEFPHMSILGYGDTTDNEYEWKCGGSLISERWVLTAAHCVRDGQDNLVRWVRLGDYDINSNDDIDRPEDYSVVKHVPHPDYKDTERYNDIALLQLEKNVEFSSFVRPICLNTDQSLDPPVLIATGWGSTGHGLSGSDVLLKVILDQIPINRCAKSYSQNVDDKLPFGIQSHTMICASSFRDNEDTCLGDSGGPLQVINDENPDTYTQFGITSFGLASCGDKNIPGIYTRVSNYIPWIEETVWPDN